MNHYQALSEGNRDRRVATRGIGQPLFQWVGSNSPVRRDLASLDEQVPDDSGGKVPIQRLMVVEFSPMAVTSTGRKNWYSNRQEPYREKWKSDAFT